LHCKIIGVPKKFKNKPPPLFGLELTMQVLKSQIHLVRQSP
jgi:hypothetical protein